MFDLGCGDRRPAVTKTASRVDASCVVLPFTSNTSGGSGGRSPPETVTNVQDCEPTEESQTRKQMKWKEEKERERQCNGPKEN